MKAIARYIDDAIAAGRAKNDADIARQCGVSRPTVSRWRSGDRTPDDDEAVKLAELLGIEAGEILAECGAARAKTPETRRAWERIAARMATSSITVCVLIIAIGQSQEAQARQVNKLLFSEVKSHFLLSPLLFDFYSKKSPSNVLSSPNSGRLHARRYQ